MMDIEYKKNKELRRQFIIGTNSVSLSTYRPPAMSDYEKRKEIEKKSIIDEINRLNLYNDYNV